MDLRSLKIIRLFRYRQREGEGNSWANPELQFCQASKIERSLRECLQENVCDGLCRIKDYPGSSDGEESACNPGDPGSIPGSQSSPGEVIGYPLQ